MFNLMNMVYVKEAVGVLRVVMIHQILILIPSSRASQDPYHFSFMGAKGRLCFIIFLT